MVAGFTMSSRTRPMTIGKFQEYISDKGVTIQSKRLIEEMKTFIWRNGRPEAQSGYNDDLVMAFSIAMYIRDTALKFKQRGIDLTRQYGKVPNPYKIDTPGGQEDISWILD